jgi:hypothetical protein
MEDCGKRAMKEEITNQYNSNYLYFGIPTAAARGSHCLQMNCTADLFPFPLYYIQPPIAYDEKSRLI